jgi:hypothetical protein
MARPELQLRDWSDYVHLGIESLILPQSLPSFKYRIKPILTRYLMLAMSSAHVLDAKHMVCVAPMNRKTCRLSN